MSKFKVGDYVISKRDVGPRYNYLPVVLKIVGIRKNVKGLDIQVKAITHYGLVVPGLRSSNMYRLATEEEIARVIAAKLTG